MKLHGEGGERKEEELKRKLQARAKKEHAAAQLIQKQIRRRKAQNYYHHKRSQAKIIQKNYRQRRAITRKHYEQRMAVKIQKTFRGLQGRHTALKLLARENFADIDRSIKLQMEEFSQQTLRRVQWRKTPNKMILQSCIRETHKLLMGSDRWDVAVMKKFRRINIGGRILRSQFKKLLGLTAQEQYLISYERSARKIQKEFRRYYHQKGELLDEREEKSDDEQKGEDENRADANNLSSNVNTAQYHQHKPHHHMMTRFSNSDEGVTSHEWAAASKIQHFVRSTTAKRKHRVDTRPKWNSSTSLDEEAGELNLKLSPIRTNFGGRHNDARLSPRRVVSTKQFFSNPKNNSPTSGRRNKKKISPLSRKYNAKRNMDVYAHRQRNKDDALTNLGHKAADWTVKNQFDNMMYPGTKESYDEAAESAQQILALQILQNLQIAEEKPVLGITKSNNNMHSDDLNQPLILEDSDPYIALLGGHISDHSISSKTKKSFKGASGRKIRAGPPVVKKSDNIDTIYPSDQFLRNQRQELLNARKNTRGLSRFEGPMTVNNQRMKEASPQERAKLRLKQRRQKQKKKQERSAAQEKQERKEKQRQRIQFRNRKLSVSPATHVAHTNVHTMKRNKDSPTLTQKQKHQLRWLHAAGERVEQVYIMLEKDKREDIVSDWIVNAAIVGRENVRSVGTAISAIRGAAQRAEERRKAMHMLKDEQISDGFRKVRRKLRAAMIGLHDDDYTNLGRVASAAAARAGVRGPATLSIEQNNWQNRLSQCIRYRLMLSEAVLPDHEMRAIVRAVAAASRADAEPANSKRASVLRAPTRSRDPQYQVHEWALLLRVVDPFRVIDSVADIAVDCGPPARRLKYWLSELPNTTQDQIINGLSTSPTLDNNQSHTQDNNQSHTQDNKQPHTQDNNQEQDDKAGSKEDHKLPDPHQERTEAKPGSALKAEQKGESNKGDTPSVAELPASTLHHPTWADIEKELYAEQDADRARKEVMEAKARRDAEELAAKNRAAAAAARESKRIIAAAEDEKQRILAEAREEALCIKNELEEKKRAAKRTFDLVAYKEHMQKEAMAAITREEAKLKAERRRLKEEQDARKAAEEKAAKAAEIAKRAAEQEAKHQAALQEAEERKAAAAAAADAEHRAAMANRLQHFIRSVLVQRQIRTSQMWKSLLLARKGTRHAAAIKIQANLRGQHGRRESNALLAEKAASEARAKAIAEEYKQRLVAEAETRAKFLMEKAAAAAASAAEAEQSAVEGKKRKLEVNMIGFSLAGAINADTKRNIAAADKASTVAQDKVKMAVMSSNNDLKWEEKEDVQAISQDDDQATSCQTGNEPVVDKAGNTHLLPNDVWISTLDPESNYFYYTNLKTNQVTWDRPTFNSNNASDVDTVNSPLADILPVYQNSLHRLDIDKDAYQKIEAPINNSKNGDGSLDEPSISDIKFDISMHCEEETVNGLETTAAKLRALRDPDDVMKGLVFFEAMISRASAPDALGMAHKKIIEARAAARSLKIVARVKAAHKQADTGENMDDVEDDVEDDDSDSFDDLDGEIE